MSEPNTAADPQRALFAALAAAAASCDWVQKRKVQGVNYSYASAESIVAEADRVFCDNGLAVVPGVCKVEQRSYAKDQSERTVLVLTREYVIVHRDGGSLVGGGVAAIGANVGGTPPQAMNSAETMCFAYFVKTLLRMPRQDEEDADHPRSGNNRSERFEDAAPARPAVAPPAARKATRVLAAIGAVKTVAEWDKARERFETQVLAERSPEDDCGYTDEEIAAIKAAIKAAAGRVGA